MTADALADQLRNFADRVEDGEIEIVELQVRQNPPRATLEGMNTDELHRMGAVLDGGARDE